MSEKPIQSVPAAEVAGKTLVEEFMSECYEFRRNVLSDKYEMREVCNEENADLQPKPWRDVTRESLNTLLGRAKRELGSVKDLKNSIEVYIYSEGTPVYDSMLTSDVVGILARYFPEIKQTRGMTVRVGRTLKSMNFERKDLMQGSAYFIVPVKSAA